MDYWIGGTPVAAKVRYDFNTAYLESTGAYPNWDYELNPADVAGEMRRISSCRKTIRSASPRPAMTKRWAAELQAIRKV